jgi:hypothetical protein
MNSYDSLFVKSVVFSIILHSILFFRVPFFKTAIDIETVKKFQVTYLKLKEEEVYLKDKLKKLEDEQAKKNLILDKSDDEARKIKPLGVEADKSRLFKPSAIRPENLINEPVALSKKIDLPDIENKQKNLPGYKNYYQLVRGKIKETAYKNYNIKDTGDVYLSFKLNKNGYLEDVFVDDVKSSSSATLVKIASSSLKDSSPFAPFPKELSSETLSFNVIISFEAQ